MPGRLIDKLTKSDFSNAEAYSETVAGYLRGFTSEDKLISMLDKTHRFNNLNSSKEIRNQYPEASSAVRSKAANTERIEPRLEPSLRPRTEYKYWNDDSLDDHAKVVAEGLEELSQELGAYMSTLTDAKEIAYLNFYKRKIDDLAAGNSLDKKADVAYIPHFMTTSRVLVSTPGIAPYRQDSKDGEPEKITLEGLEEPPLSTVLQKLDTGWMDAVITAGEIQETTDQILDHGPIWSAYNEALMRQKLQEQYARFAEQIDQSMRMMPERYEELRNGNPQLLSNSIEEYIYGPRGPKNALWDAQARSEALKAGWPMGDLATVSLVYQMQQQMLLEAGEENYSAEQKEQLRRQADQFGQIWQQMIAPGGVTEERRNQCLANAQTAFEALSQNPLSTAISPGYPKIMSNAANVMKNTAERQLRPEERELMAGPEPARYYVDLEYVIGTGELVAELASTLPDDHPQKQALEALAQEYQTAMGEAMTMGLDRFKTPGFNREYVYLSQDGAKHLMPTLKKIQTASAELLKNTSKEKQPLRYLLTDRINLQASIAVDGVNAVEVHNEIAQSASSASVGSSDLDIRKAGSLAGKSIQEQKEILQNAEKLAAADPVVQLAQLGFDGLRDAYEHIKTVQNSVQNGQPESDPAYYYKVQVRETELRSTVNSVRMRVPNPKKPAPENEILLGQNREHVPGAKDEAPQEAPKNEQPPYYTGDTVRNLYLPRAMPAVEKWAAISAEWNNRGMEPATIAGIRQAKSITEDADALESQLPKEGSFEANQLRAENRRLKEAILPDPNKVPSLMDTLNRNGISYPAYLLAQTQRLLNAGKSISQDGLSQTAKEHRSSLINSEKNRIPVIKSAGDFAAVSKEDLARAQVFIARQDFLMSGYSAAQTLANDQPVTGSAQQINVELVGSGLKNRSDEYQKMAASAQAAGQLTAANTPEEMISYYEKMIADAEKYERSHGGFSLKGIRPKGRARLRECRNVIRDGRQRLQELKEAFEDLDPGAMHIPLNQLENREFKTYQWMPIGKNPQPQLQNAQNAGPAGGGQIVQDQRNQIRLAGLGNRVDAKDGPKEEKNKIDYQAEMDKERIKNNEVKEGPVNDEFVKQ